MRILKWLFAIVVVLALLFVGGAYFLPREVMVARSTTIAAPPSVVFDEVNSLRAAEEWSPWLRRDPDVSLVYSGPEAGVGATLTWTSDAPDVGNGRQEIVVSEENERVETALDFGSMGTAKAAFLLEDTQGGTSLTWTLVADMGMSPIGRWMGLMMDDWVGADYERGLSNLKALVEG